MSTMPKRCYFKNGAWYYVTPSNKWIRLGATEQDARSALETLDFKYRTLLDSARCSARTRGIEFNLSKEEFQNLVVRAGGRCELTGIRFHSVKAAAARRRPFAPSLDRIDASKGYTANNVRLVCVAINYAMADWGSEVFDILARHRVRHLRHRLRSGREKIEVRSETEISN